MTLKKLTRGILTMLSLFAIANVSLAQTRTVTGKVTDSKGEAVPSATVTVKGTRTSTTTATDGTFKISVPSGSNALVISSIGYTTKEVSITGDEVGTVSLETSNAALNEVVVIGYGTARKKDLTGSVGSVSAKDFNKGVVTAPDQLIQGKVAGVQVLNNSGQPGAASTIRIRGTNSIRSGNQPLIVVDGVPLSGGSGRPGLSAPGMGGTPDANPLNFINPNDIASMDVLKDASATAIYGSRGANGVIIITTKKGSSGAPQVEFGYTVGTGSILKKIDVLDAGRYKAALSKYGLTAGDYGSSVDAMNAILRKSSTQNVYVAVGGGNETGRYRFSASALDEKGIIKESGLKKYTLGFTGNFKFLENKKLGLDVNLNYTQQKEDIAPVTNNAGFQGSLIGQALQWNPTHPFKKTDGTYWVEPQFGASSVNPLAMLDMYDDHININTVLASVSPYYKITKDLEYRFLYSFNQGVGSRNAMMDRNLLNFNDIKNRGWANVSAANISTQQIAHTVSFNKDITSALSLNSVAGYEYTKYTATNSSFSAYKFDNIGIKYYNMMGYSEQSSRSIYNYEAPTNELQSYFVRAGLNYSNKYLLTATVRSDGSTKFGANNKYGVFPSFAAAWNISNEKFMSTVKGINSMKLRVGWGKTGNQEFPAGASQDRYGVTGIGTLTRLNVGNPDLKWETSVTTNAGFDLAMLSNRLNITVDYFDKVTSDVLFEQDFPQPGASSAKQWKNLPAKIKNNGVEVTVTGNIIRKTDFSWNLGVNATFQKNELTDFQGAYFTGGLSGQGSSGTRVQRIVSGHPLNVFYLRKFNGIDANGQSIYEDEGYTLYYVGDPNPKQLLGISTDLTYKKLTLTVNFNGAFGHHIYNETATNVIPITNLGTRNVLSSFVDAKVKEDLSNPIAASSRFLEKGDYLKLANATLTYNIGNVTKYVRNARISLTGQNLLLFTNYSGFDPEVNVDKSSGGIPSAGIDYIGYPSVRRFQLSLNCTF